MQNIQSIFSFLPTPLSLIALARNFNTILKKSGDSKYLCFFPGLRGKTFILSPLRFFQMFLYHVEEIYSRHTEFFKIMSRCWNLSNALFCTNWNDAIFSSFCSCGWPLSALYLPLKEFYSKVLNRKGIHLSHSWLRVKLVAGIASHLLWV